LQMFDIFMPPVTVVRQPVEDLGRAAAEMLLHHLQSPARESKTALEPRNVTLPVELVIRRSCGCTQ
jgi:LacI family transcriptional regulator